MGVGLWALGCAAACSPAAPALSNAQPSREALASAVLGAIARRDPARLRALAISEQEFRAHVWPGLPAARPERNLPFSYVWGDLRQKSDHALARTMAEHAGRRYALVSVRAAGAASSYPGYVVHRDTVLEVLHGGGETTLRLFGSTIEKDGAWKVFSYVVDD